MAEQCVRANNPEQINGLLNHIWTSQPKLLAQIQPVACSVERPLMDLVLHQHLIFHSCTSLSCVSVFFPIYGAEFEINIIFLAVINVSFMSAFVHLRHQCLHKIKRPKRVCSLFKKDLYQYTCIYSQAFLLIKPALLPLG